MSPRRPSRCERAEPDRQLTSQALAAIEQACPAFAGWAWLVAAQADPKGARDAAVQAAARLLSVNSPSATATAKTLEAELRQYLATSWPRQRDLNAPPAGASALRMQLWRIAWTNDGDTLGWRRIYDLLDSEICRKSG